MIDKELYYIYAIDGCDSADNKYYVLHVTTENGRWTKHERFDEPMTEEQMSQKGIKPYNDPKAVSRYLPVVQKDTKGIIHLKAEPFVTMYHKFNPKMVYPLKPELFRTVTLLGTTCKEEPKFVKYYMTNREFLLLDEHFRSYGYYVCDYNGAVAYIKTDQMMSIMNRYGMTNARTAGGQLVMFDEHEVPKFAEPKDSEELKSDVFSGLQKSDTAKYSSANDDTDKFEIKKLRYYADTFFTMRRMGLDIESSSPAEHIKSVMDEFISSIEAYHQAVIRGTVSKQMYEHVTKQLDNISAELSEDNEKYERTERQVLSQLNNVVFSRTDAFNTMLENSNSRITRLVNLQTLCDLSSDIVTRYSQLLLAEQDVTPFLRSLETRFNFMLEGTEFRIKSPNSLYEKLYERSENPDVTPEDLFKGAKDILRYTMIFNDEDEYSENVKNVLHEIICERYKGATLDKFRNFWTPYVPGNYKGINTVIKLPDMCYDSREGKLVGKEMCGSRYCTFIPSFCFELQFHTKKSLEVKTINHELYEKSRVSAATEKERKENDIIMKNNMAAVPSPKNAEFINEISTEYINALRKSIKMMENELSAIKKKGEGLFDKNEI